MTPSDRATLIRKLGYLRANLDLLEELRGMEKEDVLGSRLTMDAAARRLQTAIESVIDCSRLLVTLEGWRNPRDEREAWFILADRGMLNEHLVQNLGRAKGFRNILVHEYVELDPALLYQHLHEGYTDLEEFAQALAAFLTKNQD